MLYGMYMAQIFTSLFRTQPIRKVKAKSKIASYKAGVFRAWRQWHITANSLTGFKLYATTRHVTSNNAASD